MALKTFDEEFWKQIEVVGMTYIGIEFRVYFNVLKKGMCE